MSDGNSVTTAGMVLVSISGPDRPGILAEVTAALADAGFALLDIQQATLLDLLGLSILVDCGPEPEPSRRLLKAAGGTALSLGLTMDAREIAAGDRDRFLGRELYALTILSDGLDTPTMARLARTVGTHKANIVTIHRLAESDLSAVEFILDVTVTPNLAALQMELLLLSDMTGVDIGLQPENAYRKSKRLIVFDVDSTLVEGEAIDELALEAGQGEAVAAATRRAMDGSVDFSAALRERVRLLAGLPMERVQAVLGRMKLTPGSEPTIRILKELGYRVGAISGGFETFVGPLKTRLGLDHAYANRLEFRDGHLTGELVGEIIDDKGKARILKEIADKERIPIEQVVGIGDGANDIPMLQAAGLGIAFGSRDKPRRAADGAIRRNDLRGILYLLGVTGRDVRKLMERSERRQT